MFQSNAEFREYSACTREALYGNSFDKNHEDRVYGQ
jgi:hypothetical protein